MIAYEVVFSLSGGHLIGTDDILPFRAIRTLSNVDFFIGSIFGVFEGHLSVFADGFIQQLNGVEELFVVFRILGHSGNVLDPGAKVDVGQSFQLFNEVYALAVRNMPGKQETVNEQTQFPRGKVPFELEIGPEIALLLGGLPGFGVGDRNHADGFRVLDVVAAIHEIEKVPPDGFSVSTHGIFTFQDFSNLGLAETMVLIRVSLENVQDIQNEHFFRLLRVHGGPTSQGIWVYYSAYVRFDKVIGWAKMPHGMGYHGPELYQQRLE